ncbi:MAG: carboxypeptidase regulatory-like domain-containing protein, partial [Gammaproteobacteria bacterium]|nr:carboxypeptidase regulatory-like domain-containing protein [Gammaproteobacteria bacterium]
MGYKVVSGVIKDAGNFAKPKNCYIKLDPVISLGDTYKGAEYTDATDASGNYSINVPVGTYDVFISYDYGRNYERMGRIQIIDNTPSPVSLSVLLNNVQVPTNNQVLLAQTSASDAAASASSAASDAAALNAHNLTGTEVAIGAGTGTGQGTNAVAIGNAAGQTTQSAGSVAVGIL